MKAESLLWADSPRHGSIIQGTWIFYHFIAWTISNFPQLFLTRALTIYITCVPWIKIAGVTLRLEGEIYMYLWPRHPLICQALRRLCSVSATIGTSRMIPSTCRAPRSVPIANANFNWIQEIYRFKNTISISTGTNTKTNSANARAQMRQIQNKLIGRIKGWNNLLTWKGHTCECSMSLSWSRISCNFFSYSCSGPRDVRW